MGSFRKAPADTGLEGSPVQRVIQWLKVWRCIVYASVNYIVCIRGIPVSGFRIVELGVETGNQK